MICQVGQCKVFLLHFVLDFSVFISRLLLLTLLSHTPSLQRVIPRRSSSQECFSFSTQMDLIDELRTHLQKLSGQKCQTHPFGWNVTSLWNRFGQTWLINSQGPNPKFLRIFKFTKKVGLGKIEKNGICRNHNQF